MNCCTWFSSCVQGGGVNESAYSDIFRKEACEPQETALEGADLKEEAVVPSEDFAKFIPLTKAQLDDKLGRISTEAQYSAYFNEFVAHQKNSVKPEEEARDRYSEETVQHFTDYRQAKLQEVIQAEWDWKESYNEFKGSSDSSDIPSAMEFRLQWLGESNKVQLYSADQKVQKRAYVYRLFRAEKSRQFCKIRVAAKVSDSPALSFLVKEPSFISLSA